MSEHNKDQENSDAQLQDEQAAERLPENSPVTDNDNSEIADQQSDALAQAEPQVDSAENDDEVLAEEIAIDIDTQQQSELEDARLGQEPNKDEHDGSHKITEQEKTEHQLTDEKDNPRTPKELPQIIEAALMAYGNTLKIESLQELFDEHEEPSRNQIKAAIAQLQIDMQNRGIEVKEVASGYRLQVKQSYSQWVGRLWDEKPQRYSRALMETLALIAYRQPVTRGDIEDVRGVVVSSQTIRTLLDREWVKVVGYRDVPGRPSMYATTKDFLDYFNFKTLEELPTLAEVKEMDDANRDLELEKERAASATREYDFNNQEEVEARGADVLAETEEDLAQAELLIQQVEDNVFNKPEEEEEQLEAELAEPSANEPSPLGDRETGQADTSMAALANKFTDKDEAMAAYRNSAGLSDMADKLADRLAEHEPVEQTATEVTNDSAQETVSETAPQLPAESDSERESRLLREEQEQLMQRLMQEAHAEQKNEQAVSPLDTAELTTLQPNVSEANTTEAEQEQEKQNVSLSSPASLFGETVEHVEAPQAQSTESAEEDELERLAREELEMIELEQAAEQALLDEEQNNH